MLKSKIQCQKFKLKQTKAETENKKTKTVSTPRKLIVEIDTDLGQFYNSALPNIWYVLFS